jgi:AmmeMemoRadiSam system protein B/AmmeMemoRadiSam system protein A
MAVEKIRESVIAGTWYPGQPEILKREIQKYLAQVDGSPLQGELIGLVSPHAGYRYSGGVAAHAYKLLEQHSFDRVVIIAPSHRAYFKGASIYNLGGYSTPLGVVPLDRELVDGLMEHSPLISYVPQAHAQEHSLEIQLPFLQVILKDFMLTPIVLGEQSLDFCAQLAAVISQVCRGKRVLLVASSDLSHYHSYKEAKKLDQIVMDRVAAFDAQGLSKNLRTGDCEACGGGPIMTLMLAARDLGADVAKILHYANSGDVTGETGEVVGYMSAAFYTSNDAERAQSGGNKSKVGVDLGLSAEEKQTLKEIAREAIRGRCLGQTMPEMDVRAPKLQEARGAFVCIKKAGELRGCIGMIEGRGPLHETIRSMAVQAAFADPRFCALDKNELEEIDLEISVLTPLVRMQDPSEIEIGKHGLWIRKGYYSGLLLPQVATEQGWDRGQFLEWTCKKAGLPPNAWKEPDAEVYCFSADIF